MNKSEPWNRRLIWLGVGLTGALLLLAAVLALLHTRKVPNLPVLGQIADFSLTNQNGRAVSLADLRGRAWIADIIFTRCAGPCPRMSRQMKELQQALPVSGKTRLITLTTDPDFDTPEVLQRYAERFSANQDRWWFLTGTKDQIRSLATDSLKLTAVEKKPEERENPQDLFIHSTIFVLVDENAQLRGIYQTSEDQEWAAIKSKILGDVRNLEREQ